MCLYLMIDKTFLDGLLNDLAVNVQYDLYVILMQVYHEEQEEEQSSASKS